MISREELRQLADFECRLPGEFAITFYFEPGTPKDKSHREEVIEAKDLVRRTLQELELNGKHRNAISDLQRILQLVESLRGNQARAKAVFACAARGFWKEFDLPSGVVGSQLFVNRRFHLKPVAPLMSDHPRLWVAVLDRQNARFLEVEFDSVREQGTISNILPRHGRSDGFAGYNGGHAERRLEGEFRRHFQEAAEFLMAAVERKLFDALVIGCQDITWPEIDAQLHPDVKKKLIGQFSAELAALSNEKAAEAGQRVVRETVTKRHHELLGAALNGARSNGRGVTGLRRVLRATEQGEVDTIIMSRDYSARAVECTNCRHLDSHLVPYCPACGRSTRQLDDVCEALVPLVVRNSLGLVLLPPDETLDRVGNIAAVLRFRADQNVNQSLAS
jgi:peptide subunit release factor 1 (eRF1)